MTEGWFGDEYLVSFNEAEIASASDRYSISRFIPGYQLIGLRGWDDLIVKTLLVSHTRCLGPHGFGISLPRRSSRGRIEPGSR
jgi:hypothetical protein